MAKDPLLVPKLLQRLRRADPAAARRAERALGELLAEGGLGDLTQLDLQSFLWFALAEDGEDDPQATAIALADFFDLAEMHRYSGIARSELTVEILLTYLERGQAVGVRMAHRAMDASGILPPDLPELEWGQVMGPAEMTAFQSIATALELALAAGELRPGARGWRTAATQLAHQQLTMVRLDGPPLLDRVRAERLNEWADLGGHERRGLASAVLAELVTQPPPPPEAATHVSPMQWLLEIAEGRDGPSPGVPLTVGGNLARKVVQDAAQRFGWWDTPERSPRSETDLWLLTELRELLQKAGLLRKSGRRLLLGPRGRAIIDDPVAQWQTAMDLLVDGDDFAAAAQEAALMLLVSARGLVGVRELIAEAAGVLASSGWRDTGNGSLPDERDVSRAVWRLVRRFQLWTLVDESLSADHMVRLRLTEAGRRAGHAALRSLALRPRLESD